ncbi:MAG: hypothetical protein IPN22_07280 [Bacteroidetes bacterium]|nr:hypothetical protein [Bacteroidota bacterium]
MKNRTIHKIVTWGYQIAKLVAALIVISSAIVGVLQLSKSKTDAWIFLVLWDV